MSARLPRRVVANMVADKLVSAPAERKRWVKILAAYMVEQKLTSIHEIDAMLRDIVREIFNKSGHLLVETTSARPLTQTMRSELSAAMRSLTGATKIELKETVDKELIGGFIARTPDAELDSSIKTTLQNLAAIK